MPTARGDRSAHFPAIEKKHGGPISLWIERVNDLGKVKYEEQIAFLRENHGFSQTHANALVMYVRGSTTSKKFDGPDAFFAKVDPVAARTAKAIFAAVTEKHPTLELVMAWNQPMLRNEKGYVLGVMVSKNHLTVAPFGGTALEAVGDRLAKYTVNKKTFQVPLDEGGCGPAACNREGAPRGDGVRLLRDGRCE